VDTIDVSNRWPLTPSDGFSRAASSDHDADAAPGGTAPRRPHAAGPPGLLPSGLAARWLDRTLRIVDEGPQPFFRAAVISLAVTSALAAGAAALIRPQGALPGTQRHLIAGALAGLGLSAVFGLASLAAARRSRRAAWLDRVAAPRERAAIWLALAAWLPFLLVVVYYRAKATFPPPAEYVYFPYDDKRWETTAYLLGVVAPAIWLTTAARVLAVGRGKPPTWRAWFTGLFSGSRR
jgi:hypothetical protein